MTNERFCDNVLSLIGRPYSEVDCIAVVRLAANIRCQGTNWLWRSFKNSGKYQYLSERWSLPPAVPDILNGMLVFRIKWNQTPSGYSDTPNCHHVGVIVGEDVVQSSEDKGVYRKRYTPAGWNGGGWLRMIEDPTDAPNWDGPEHSDGIISGSGPDKLPETEHSTDPSLETIGFTTADHAMLMAIYNYLIRD